MAERSARHRAERTHAERSHPWGIFGGALVRGDLGRPARRSTRRLWC